MHGWKLSRAVKGSPTDTKSGFGGDKEGLNACPLREGVHGKMFPKSLVKMGGSAPCQKNDSLLSKNIVSRIYALLLAKFTRMPGLGGVSYGLPKEALICEKTDFL